MSQPFPNGTIIRGHSGDFELIEDLGDGPYGRLFRIRDSLTGARKFGAVDPFSDDSSQRVTGYSSLWVELISPMRLGSLGGTARALSRLKQLTRLKHRYAIQCIEARQICGGAANGWIYAITAPRGTSLEQILNARQSLAPEQRRKMILDVLRGLSAANRIGLVHGLQASNIYRNGESWQIGPAIAGDYLDHSDASRSDVTTLADRLPIWLTGSKELSVSELVCDCLQPRQSAARLYLELTGAAIPLPVEELRIIERRRPYCLVDWVSPPTGETRLVENNDGRRFQSGEVFLSDEIEAIGVATGIAARPAQLTIPSERMQMVTVVTLIGEAAVIGASLLVGPVDDVTDLQVRRSSDGVSLSWIWPDGVNNAWVIWRQDRLPEGPEDPLAQRRLAMRNSNIGYSGQQLMIESNRVKYIAVYAAVPIDRTRWLYAGGVSVEPTSGNVLRIYYHYRHNFLSQDGTLRIWTDVDSRLPALVLVEQQRGYPTSAQHGREILEIPMGTPCIGGQPREWSYQRAYNTPRSGLRLFSRNAGQGIDVELLQS